MISFRFFVLFSVGLFTGASCSSAAGTSAGASTGTASASSSSIALCIAVGAVTGIHSAVMMHVIPAATDKASASAVGDIAVDDIHLRDDQQKRSQHGNDPECPQRALQLVIGITVIKVAVFHRLGVEERTLTVRNLHHHVFAALQGALPGEPAGIIVLRVGGSNALRVLPAEGILLHGGGVEPSGDEFVISLLVIAV